MDTNQEESSVLHGSELLGSYSITHQRSVLGHSIDRQRHQENSSTRQFTGASSIAANSMLSSSSSRMLPYPQRLAQEPDQQGGVTNTQPIGIPFRNDNGRQLAPLQSQQQQASGLSSSQFGFQTQRNFESFSGPNPASTTSSYFSTSSASRFAPHTNEPSSASSSYKSATATAPINNSSYHSFSSVSGGGFPTTSYSERHSSLFARQNSSGAMFNGQSFINSGSSPPSYSAGDNNNNNNNNSVSTSRGNISRINSESVKPPTVRTSLLTSKLHSNQNAASGPSSMSLPYPTMTSPRGNSIGTSSSYTSDPRNFTTTVSSSNQSYQQPFLPHPSSTTTNISRALTSGSSSNKSVASSTETLNRTSDVLRTHLTPNNSDESSFSKSSELFQKEAKVPTPGTSPMSSNTHTSSSEDVDMEDQHRHNYDLYEDEILADSLQPHLNIATHSTPDLLVMLTALLQKIIDANDALQPPHYNFPSSEDLSIGENGTINANALAFHGRNIPAISLHAYLSRILKYCPTTNEVFISLLVYFDRIAHRANNGELSSLSEMAEDGRTPSESSSFFL